MADRDKTAFHLLDPRSARARLSYAAALAAIGWFLVPTHMAWTMHLLAAIDLATLFITVVDLHIIATSNAEETKRRAAAEDPGRALVWVIVLLTSMFGLLAAAVLMRQGKTAEGFEGRLHIILCVVTVVLSWMLTHASFTLRYAHLYYRGDGDGGIAFPTPDDKPLDPDDHDFAYFAFTIGMTFQVSDTDITSREIRRTVLRHGLLSFAYNTVIVALSLNLVVGQFT
ncbi:MAG TPA: DUF1345 domain-containing protein [Kofleriaceae bacterium]